MADKANGVQRYCHSSDKMVPDPAPDQNSWVRASDYEQLQAKLEAAERELSFERAEHQREFDLRKEAERDAARLDFLIAALPDSEIYDALYPHHRPYAEDHRAAIDAAIDAQRQEGK